MRLRAPRRAKLRTRVLLGVLAVTLLALVAFDIAAVTALRGYLIGQTDQQLHEVLSLYRVMRAPHGPARERPLPAVAPNWQRKVIGGPRAVLPGALGQFEVVTLSGSRPTMSIRAGSDLLPGSRPACRPWRGVSAA